MRVYERAFAALPGELMDPLAYGLAAELGGRWPLAARGSDASGERRRLRFALCEAHLAAYDQRPEAERLLFVEQHGLR